MIRPSRPSLWLGTVALTMVGLALMATVIPFRQIVDQQNRLESARLQLVAVQEQNQLLDQEVGALNTPEETERLAREKLGYVMPGETAYVILDPPANAAPTTALPPAEPKSIPWYRAIWNFFTGADLAGDQSQG